MAARKQPPAQAAARERREAAVTKATDARIERFRTGQIADLIEQTLIERHPDDVTPMHNLSAGNQWMLLMQGATDARGYGAWQQVGRNVTQGAHAVWIWAPNTRTVKDTDEGGEETEHTIVTGFRPQAVFDLSATEGDPLPSYDYEPATAPPLAEVAEAMGLTVEYAGYSGGGARGLYRPSANLVRLYTTDQRTWWHELAHAAHDQWLHAQGRAILAEPTANAEAVAEAAAAVIAGMYDVDQTGNAWAYIEHYVGEGNVVRTLMGLAKEVTGTVATILAVQAEQQQAVAA